MTKSPRASGISRRSVISALPAQAGADPLPSWNDGAAKQAILAFVRDTTTDRSSLLEALRYLRANGYKTYIVTGGGQDLVRAYAQRA